MAREAFLDNISNSPTNPIWLHTARLQVVPLKDPVKSVVFCSRFNYKKLKSKVLMSLIKKFETFEKTVGGMKFAVIIILLFAAALTVGTFVESYHGTDYANRLIYKSWPFMLLQFCMFLSITYATLLRMPFKKRLYGFYVLHLGLILIFLGSYVTYHAGVDGNITLPPKTPNNQIIVNQDQLKIVSYDENKTPLSEFYYDLPYIAGETNLGITLKQALPADKIIGLEDLVLKDYLPFAQLETTWKESTEPTMSSRYHLFNDRFGEKLILTLKESEDFKSSLTLGPLSIHYMPSELFECFKENDPTQYIVWDYGKKKCYLPKQINAKIDKTQKSREFLVLPVGSIGNEKVVKFFPDYSPIPIIDKTTLDTKSSLRVLSKKLFIKSPHLFLFGRSVAFYDKGDEKWCGKTFKSTGAKFELPWMGFQIKLLEHLDQKYPVKTPNYIKPIVDNGKVIEGDNKAISVEMKDKITGKSKTFWITDNKPLGLASSQRQLDFQIIKKAVKLPYKLTLDRFKMDKDPGTQNPASYESFVSIFDGQKTDNAHVFMNNPLKKDHFTFYQASFFKAKSGGNGSVLSVNFDPGRWLKYLGSLLLVLGSIWHFGFAKRRKKKA